MRRKETHSIIGSQQINIETSAEEVLRIAREKKEPYVSTGTAGPGKPSDVDPLRDDCR